jgi:uncharacterized protein
MFPSSNTFTSQTIHVHGQSFIPDRSGALYWPSERTLIVADLHLEKGSSRASRGRLLPPYDTRATLLSLAQALERHAPETVIALGDSLHDCEATDRITQDDLASLHALQTGRDWLWLTGNHDPRINPVIGGRSTTILEHSGLTFRHEPSPAPAPGEIAGHLHPAAKLETRGPSIRRPCFIGNGDRLVLPAFGAFTGGLNVLDEAFAPLFTSNFAVWMLGRDSVYPVAVNQLRGD